MNNNNNFRAVTVGPDQCPQVRQAACPWCGDPILSGEPTAMSDGERMHIGCAADEMDNATFDRDMGFD